MYQLLGGVTMNTYFGQIGGKLRQIRLDKGYTLETVAEKIGLTIKAIQLYEMGQRKISNPTIAKLLKIYHYDLDQFWDETKIYLDSED